MDILYKWEVFWEKFGPGEAWRRVLGEGLVNTLIIAFAGLAIGLSLVLVHLVCIRYTGTSVNPARSIGPALFQGGEALSQLWIFIVGPFVGGALAALVWKAIGSDKK